MAEEAIGDGARYWSFISYSHKDAAFGRRLHRSLESYVLPRHLTGGDKLPRRLTPIFRDREELPASGDLSAEVRAALAASRSLIVVCSPDAAASQWVGREVALFRALHPDRPILAAIRSGEPAECFPQALRHTGVDGAAIEPLAADFRRGRDGEALGLLKLVAGIAGVGLDALVQRDAQRKFRRVTAVTAVALAAMLVMAALTGYALHARSEAERQRAEAEGLVEYMLTDLRDRLQSVGRLDVMVAVDRRALGHYAGESLADLPPDSLARRARLLHAIGEDVESQGALDVALQSFREARRTTSALLAQAPHDPKRIFDQSQNEFWIGTIEYARRNKAAAMRSFLAYKHLTDQLVAIAPGNPVYRAEAAFADGDLCMTNLSPPADTKTAVAMCRIALAEMERAARDAGPSEKMAINLINRHAWLADAYLADGDIVPARAERIAEKPMIDRELAIDPHSLKLCDLEVSREIGLARIEEASGHAGDARQALEGARRTLDGLIAADRTNTTWSDQRSWVNGELAKLH
jgi:hypothetical protein